MISNLGASGAYFQYAMLANLITFGDGAILVWQSFDDGSLGSIEINR
jgi:hypothetical protein